MSKQRVFIVDNDRALLRQLCLRCQRLGFDVTATHDVLSGLKHCYIVAPDLLCLDADLFAGDALTVFDVMKHGGNGLSTPTIVLTSESLESNVRYHSELPICKVSKRGDVSRRVGRIVPLIVELLRPKLRKSMVALQPRAADAVFAAMGAGKHYLDQPEEDIPAVPCGIDNLSSAAQQARDDYPVD